MRGRKRINTRKEVPRRAMGGPLSAALFFFKRLKKYIYLATSGLNGSTWDVVP